MSKGKVTSLHVCRQADGVALLMDHKANVHARTALGITPLTHGLADRLYKAPTDFAEPDRLY